MQRGAFFVADEAHQLPVAWNGRAYKALVAAIEACHTRLAAQATATKEARGLRVAKQRAREVLRVHAIGPIAAISELRSDGPPVPHVTLPWKRVQDTELVAEGRGTMSAVRRHRRAFIEWGANRDFIDVLRGATEELEHLLVERGIRMSRVRRATVALESAIRRGRAALRTLDGLVVADLRRTAPELIPAWKASIRYKTRRR